MIPRTIVTQDQRCAIQHTDHDIDLAIIIQDRQTPHHALPSAMLKAGPAAADTSTNPLPVLRIKQWSLFVLQIAGRLFDRVEHVTLGDEDVSQAIVVSVNKVSAPAGIKQE